MAIQFRMKLLTGINKKDTRHILYTDKMEFHVLELPKLPKELREDCSDLELWGKFINFERKEDFDMLAEKNTYIESAYEQLQVISQDQQRRLEYEARLKVTLDYNQGILEAEQRGIDRINKLNTLLLQQKRYDDIERSANDIKFQQQLMSEYGI